MPAERRATLLTRRGVPQTRRSIGGCGDDALAVGTERDAKDRVDMASSRLADGPAGRYVPQTRCPVIGCADNEPAVGAERGGRYKVGVTSEWLADRLARHRVP